MKRIWLLFAIMVLAIGCSQDSVVKNEDGSESAGNSTTATTEDNEDESNQENVKTDVSTDEAPEARGDDEAGSATDESDDPQAALAELRDNGASPAELIAFAEKNLDDDAGFEALTIVGQRRNLDADNKAKLLDLMKTNFLLNEASNENQALMAARMLLGIGGAEHRDSVTDAIVERFVTGKKELDRSASRVLGLVMQQGSEAAKQKVADQLVENFADDEGMLGFVQQLSRGIPSGSTVALLKSLIERSSEDSIKGTSMMTLAQLYASVPDTKGFVDDERFKAAFPQETIDFIKNFDPEEYAGEIEMLLTKVKDDYGDVSTRRGTLGEMAETELFVIQNLSIGKTAPDIVGEDLDGEEFKLSDYRGKVVMLDFWGDW